MFSFLLTHDLLKLFSFLVYVLYFLLQLQYFVEKQFYGLVFVLMLLQSLLHLLSQRKVPQTNFSYHSKVLCFWYLLK